MPYFLRIVPQLVGTVTQVWKVEDANAEQIGVSGAGPVVVAAPGETIWDALQRMFGAGQEKSFHKIPLEPGEYYPRMARPIDQHLDESPGYSPGAAADAAFVATSVGQLAALTGQLSQICQTVHPDGSNMQVFGHDMRNLLILACTEVETHWRGVLETNGVVKKVYCTHDYFKLLNPMRLNEYAVSFPRFPWLPPTSPFVNWDIGSPTRSLPWYDAYNAVKHNREGEFARATLQNVFDAVSACAIMQVAQFGRFDDSWRNSDAAKFFHFHFAPTWLPGEVYVYPYDMQGAGRTPVHFPF